VIEIHEYEPTPKDIVKAQSADLILWNGLNLERWFERFLAAKPRAITDRLLNKCFMRSP